MSNVQVALQLYTVRDQTQQDFVGTLQEVAKLGYKGVEFAGYGGLSAQALTELLTRTGLRTVSSHIGLAELTDEHLDASIAYCRAIGCPTIILPYLTEEWRTLEGIQRLAPRLNAIGEQCRAAGLTFGYHNHAFEFEDINRQTWYDHLLQLTDPALVKVELDIYWVAFANHDPLTL